MYFIERSVLINVYIQIIPRVDYQLEAMIKALLNDICRTVFLLLVHPLHSREIVDILN